MSTALAHEALSTLIQRINQSWVTQNFAELEHCFAPEIVQIPPGFQGRRVGREAAIASYREFMQLAQVEAYQEGDIQTEVFGDTGIVTYRFAIDYVLAGVRYHDTGHDLFVCQHTAEGWRAIWRTLVPESSEDTAA